MSDELALEIKRVLAADRSDVFRAFAPDELASWWGPAGFTVPSLDFDPRAGAGYRIEMQPPEGDPFHLTGEFREVDPPARLAFTFEWEDPDPDDVETLVTLSFRDLGESTEVALDQRTFKTEARRELHRNGWSDSFDKLQAHVERPLPTPVSPSDAAAVTAIVAAVESSLYGPSTFSQSDLEEEWTEIDLERDARVVRDGGRVVGYCAVRERGELWRVEGYVHPDALGRGIGRSMAAWLEQEAARGGARRIQNNVLEADSAARSLLESLGYVPVRVFRELRIELDAPPPAPEWPDGLRVVPFDPEHDAHEFHAAQQEAFADHWDYTPRDFDWWSKVHFESERFDPTLWCVVRAGDEIAAGTICTGDTYGGGFVNALFTRRPWRGQGVGAALLRDVFGRFWERGERSVGLGVDSASDTGAFRLYERAGMTPALGWVLYEKKLAA
jgi:mycothiol synthase